MMLRSRLLFMSPMLLMLAACTHGAPALPGPGIEPRLTAYQREILSALTGESEIRPGVTITNRALIENRREARTYLAAQLTRIGLTPERQAYGTEGENVYAVLSCGRPGAETVVFGAHYDSVRVAPGASDNGTGVSTVLATARELVRVKGRTRDIIVVFFDEEERGLVGARHFAEMLKDQRRPVHSVHTVDQVGWDENGNRAIELELPYAGAVDVYTKAAAALGMTMPIWETTETGSDHSAFRRLDFKAIGITEEYRHKDTSPQIHKAGDTLATVNFSYLAATTRLMIQVMTGLVTASS
jgi:acetylornithine deacetylase/succinyl-diaminopimelate desuccinylase-like protein